MTVTEAKLIALDWVHQKAVHIPGFRAAFYHGSINWLDDDALLPITSDVDIIVVLDDPQSHGPGKFTWNNLVLEVTYMHTQDFQSAEQVLRTFYLAGNFRKPNIIADISGHFKSLQRAVAAQYASRYWVYQRCEDAAQRSLHLMEQLQEQAPLHDQVAGWLFARGLMAHVLLVAGLENPTVRKRYVAVKELLAACDMEEFHERLLEPPGFATMGRAEVERHLRSLAAAFDAAAAVSSTPYRFAADISETGRSIAIDGSYELMEAGLHREAMFWIVATYCRCQHILSQDAPPEIQEKHTAGFMELLDALNITTFAEREAGNRAARLFMEEVREVADKIINHTIAQSPLYTSR